MKECNIQHYGLKELELAGVQFYTADRKSASSKSQKPLCAEDNRGLVFYIVFYIVFYYRFIISTFLKISSIS